MAAAYLVGKAVQGAPGEIHTTAKNIVGTECDGYDANGAPARYIYLKGNASLDNGKAVTYDEAGVTTNLAANAKGPVAFWVGLSGATTGPSASEYGWFVKKAFGGVTVDMASSVADNATLGRETTDGLVGDGRAAGDQIVNAISRSTDSGGAGTIQVMDGPWVDDFQGA